MVDSYGKLVGNYTVRPMGILWVIHGVKSPVNPI